MKLLAAILLFVVLSGCIRVTEFVASQVPSLEYCDEVTYYRKGLNASLIANCRVPVR